MTVRRKGSTEKKEETNLGVALCHDRQQLGRSRLRRLERKSHQALNSNSSEDGDLGSDLPRRADVCPSSLTCVLSLGVLPTDDPVEISRSNRSSTRRGDALEDDGRSDVDELLELLSHGQDEVPEGDVVGDVGVAYGTEEDGV